MESEVIFYIAGKTAANSVQLKKSLIDVNIAVNNVCFATDVKKFVKLLSTAVSRSKLIFIIGGLTDFSDNNVITVLSKALNIKLKIGPLPLLEGVQVLENCWGANGSFLESGNQSICVLPDEPEQIDIIMNTQLKSILSKKYNLPIESCILPPEHFFKDMDSNIIMGLDSRNNNIPTSISLEDIKEILPEDINRELFRELNQESSYDKSGISSFDNKDIFEDINGYPKTEISHSPSDIIHEYPSPELEVTPFPPRHAAPEEDFSSEITETKSPIEQFSLDDNSNSHTEIKQNSVFKDPDIELSTIDLNAELKKRAKIKLNTEAQNIVVSQTQEFNNKEILSLSFDKHKKSNSGNSQNAEFPEHLNANENNQFSETEKSSQNNDTDLKSQKLHQQNQEMEDTPDEELLLQSIKKSKASILTDILLVVLILTAIGCAVYIYYKIFLG